jgi:hypothetical protein
MLKEDIVKEVVFRLYFHFKNILIILKTLNYIEQVMAFEKELYPTIEVDHSNVIQSNMELMLQIDVDIQLPNL